MKQIATSQRIWIGTLLIVMISIFSSCTKDVKIDIPGFQEQIVIDGSIETGMPPIVIISRSKDIYSPTNLEAFVNSFVTDAQVFVSDGTTEYQLSLLCSNNLPPGTEELVAGFLGVTVQQLAQMNICAYTSMDAAIWGQVGKTYHLRVEHEGKQYTGTTQILQPHALDDVWWEQENSVPGYGFSHARLSDPAGVYDAYKWEVKRINMVNGAPKDSYFKTTFSPVNNDEFFDGKTFDFYYENPWTVGDETIVPEHRGYYQQGDSVVVKFSKIDKGVYDFLYTKVAQAMSSGNPFASSMNVKTNLVGGCLGAWAGYSPVYDTLVCQ
jgi:hypothetical protein